MKKIFTALLFSSALFLSAPAAHALSVNEIVAKANHAAYYQGEDGRARVKMDITDSQGRKRTRDFVILRKDIGDDDKEQKFYVYFNRPADVSKTVFMVWKHVNGDDDRWLYLPALDLVKRIAATDERTSFVGSDFFYEDVSGRNPSEDTHELLEETDNYYILKSTPKKPDQVEFSYFKSYIHKETFIPVKIEFFDKNGEKYREGSAEAVDTIQGHPTVTKGRMKDLRSGSETVLSYSSVQYDAGLPEDIFTERYLRQAPTEYIKR
ncbi:MAG: outer membrane lipoprotein-sorting protein [Rhodospirillales bacterium]|nr:outer membrane lipoprotein-sorting protein [Rhodospirillales bacterium]MCB9965272.1 outer membrane lipoprotein-sorting protein [Rhodospirillales bacterium]MCB9972958.1 outer membrane lipoprotein-sorting protein [Rhodospirillales bacterium]MCB9980054.1 outer membrane lipoprotein-sorting protein [Rhodospirillales bacterium]